MRTKIGLLILSCALLSSCTRKDSDQRAEPVPSASAVVSSALPTVTSSNVLHDPAHPPIDCPLRKHGIAPNQLRPFDDVAKYIEFLNRPDRLAWQKPDEVVKELGFRGDEVVFDLGAGSGYFAFRFATAVPRGRVIAADTEAEMIRHVHHRTMAEGLNNLEVRLIQDSDPGVDRSADLVFLCDVLHHVSNRSTWLAKVVASMKSGAHLALIEFKQGQLPEGPPESAKIPHQELTSWCFGSRDGRCGLRAAGTIPCCLQHGAGPLDSERIARSDRLL